MERNLISIPPRSGSKKTQSPSSVLAAMEKIKKIVNNAVGRKELWAAIHWFGF